MSHSSENLSTDAFDQFVLDGIGNLGAVLDKEQCLKLLDQVKATRDFSSELFLSEEDYEKNEKNPSSARLNPGPGFNLAEEFNLDFIERDPSIVHALKVVLGENYRINHKKFIVGMPHIWMPEWMGDKGQHNLDKFIKPQFREMTYFRGVDLHQDAIDYRRTPEIIGKSITLYIYLHDVTTSHAPLYFVPGSHKFGHTAFPHNIETLGDNKIEYTDDNGHSAVLPHIVLTGSTGTVNFWSNYSLHGTKPVDEDIPRFSLRYLISKDHPEQPGKVDEIVANLQGPEYLGDDKRRKDLDENGNVIVRKSLLTHKVS